MRIAIDGPDGAGKTTLVKKLADQFGCDILHMTEKGSKDFFDYVDKAKLKYVISDRSFLSEFVYSKVFDRPSKLSRYEYKCLLDYYWHEGWQIIILNANPNCLMSRLNLRGDEDKCKIHNITKIYNAYNELSAQFDLPIINSENFDVDELIKDLEAKKYVRHNR